MTSSSPCPVAHSIRRRGFTLVEISLCVALLIVLTVGGFAGVGYISKMNAARQAEAILQQVDNARMSYLADNPSSTYSDLSLALITNYMADPSILSNLPSLGYTLTDANVKAYPLTYGTVSGSKAIPLSGF